MRGIADDCNAKAWQKKGGNCLALGRACPWSGGWLLQVRLRAGEAATWKAPPAWRPVLAAGIPSYSTLLMGEAG